MKFEFVDPQLLIEPPTPEEIEYGSRKHTGLFYRANVSSYSQLGTIGERKTLKLLKRRSCKGCHTCDFIEEEMREFGVEGMDKIEHGKIYSVVIDAVDRSSYFDYDYDVTLRLVEVKE